MRTTKRAIVPLQNTTTLLVCTILLMACGGGGDGGSEATTSASGGSGPSTTTSSTSATDSGGDTTTGSSSTSAQSVAEACDRASRAGTLGLRLSDNKTLLSGAILDAVNPDGVFEVIASEGECTLLGPRNLFCSECPSGETCAGEETCIPTPTKQSAGAVSIGGLAVTLEANPNGITGEYSSTVTDPYPAFDPGATLSLTASGDFFEAFALEAYGIPPMETSLATAPVARDTPVALTWNTDSVDPDQSEVLINFSVNVHGATTGWIECVVPDSGGFDMPADLVTQLIDLGLSGFPRMDLVRRSIASTSLSTGDCVEFEVSSSARIELEVEGLISCNDDMPCPEGLTCTTELACE